ncbi:hypothetical protein DXG03_007988 [Asterophora parasitica]|uniref:CRIB domain-containing protein n=1 Tax=Asterophora parasitica TaxID=117018 RepID=A0A9P7G9K5_9AGAR|nr:hypothetical protein DXG03_007988 [Asterophora parasitica]
MSMSMRGKSPSPTVKGTIFPYMVSLPSPNSFVHVAHVGLNKDGVIEASQGIDPSWKAVLEGHGLDCPENRRTPEIEQVPFSDGFWRGLDARKIDDKIGVKSQATQEKLAKHQPLNIRRRMPAPSFTMF